VRDRAASKGGAVYDARAAPSTSALRAGPRVAGQSALAHARLLALS